MSAPAPVVTVTEAGVYVRLGRRRRPFQTVARPGWPHFTIDLDRRGRVIGFEAVPLPRRFNLCAAARRAGVTLPTRTVARAQIHLKIAAF